MILCEHAEVGYCKYEEYIRVKLCIELNEFGLENFG